DFPMVTITPSPTKVYLAAVQQFAAELATPDAVHVLTAAGLRDADASAPGDHSDGATTGDQPVSRAPAATPARMARAERLWIPARAPGQLLAVIDVSGSMNDDSGDGQAKIQVASQAAATAV